MASESEGLILLLFSRGFISEHQKLELLNKKHNLQDAVTDYKTDNDLAGLANSFCEILSVNNPAPDAGEEISVDIETEGEELDNEGKEEEESEDEVQDDRESNAPSLKSQKRTRNSDEPKEETERDILLGDCNKDEEDYQSSDEEELLIDPRKLLKDESYRQWVVQTTLDRNQRKKKKRQRRFEEHWELISGGIPDPLSLSTSNLNN